MSEGKEVKKEKNSGKFGEVKERIRMIMRRKTWERIRVIIRRKKRQKEKGMVDAGGKLELPKKTEIIIFPF